MSYWDKLINRRIICPKTWLKTIQVIVCITKLSILSNMSFSKLFKDIGNTVTRGDHYWLLVYWFFMNRQNVFLFPIIWENTRFQAVLKFHRKWFYYGWQLSFTILTEMLSYPWAFFASLHNWIIFSSFSLSKLISYSLFSVWYILNFGSVLLLCRGWHCLPKKSLSKFAFSINLSLTRRGSIIGFFFYWRKFWVTNKMFLMT